MQSRGGSHEGLHSSSSPSEGDLADLAGDGTLVVVLNETEKYGFSNACGVCLPMIDVLRREAGKWTRSAFRSLCASFEPASRTRLFLV